MKDGPLQGLSLISGADLLFFEAIKDCKGQANLYNDFLPGPRYLLRDLHNIKGGLYKIAKMVMAEIRLNAYT